MNKQPIVVAPGTYPRALNVVGERITVLAPGAATGSYEIFLQEGPEGSGPPPHDHPWDEAFYVTGGRIEFGIAEQTMTASAGTFVHVPAGMTHWFRFGQRRALSARRRSRSSTSTRGAWNGNVGTTHRFGSTPGPRIRCVAPNVAPMACMLPTA